MGWKDIGRGSRARLIVWLVILALALIYFLTIMINELIEGFYMYLGIPMIIIIIVVFSVIIWYSIKRIREYKSKDKD